MSDVRNKAFDRRQFLSASALALYFAAHPSNGQTTAKELNPAEGDDWSCPMDPDVHLSAPGKCPHCGMQLVLKVPDRLEFPLTPKVEPPVIHPGDTATLSLRVHDGGGTPVDRFELVHEKLMHVFVVSQSLQFFAHVHPVASGGGLFRLPIQLPEGGMYRILADYYPFGSVPQLALGSFYVTGQPSPARFPLGLAPQKATNLEAALTLDPPEPVGGSISRLTFTLTPGDGLEPYLGAMGHMLVASEDLVDLIHIHPFLIGGSAIQFNVLFPRACKYRIWTQFQRRSVVNTVAFGVVAREL